MLIKTYGKVALVAVGSFILATSGGTGMAQNVQAPPGTPPVNQSQPEPYKAGDTMQQVNEAAGIVKKMKTDPQLNNLLQKSKGVFIVPTYGRAGWGIGIRGGEGVMVANNNGNWSNPVFYNVGGVSIGAQAGAEAGSIAMLLMNDKAMNEFMKENNFSVTGGVGLTIVNYTAKAQAVVDTGDVVVWADTKGAFANLTIGMTDIRYDESDNRAFYKSQVNAREIIGGKVKSEKASTLKQALSEGK